MLWAATMVPYPRAYEVYGLEFLMQPTNFLSFTITVFGLLALALTALAASSSCNKKSTTKNQLNLHRDGYGGFWQLFPLQHTLLLPHRQATKHTQASGTK